MPKGLYKFFKRHEKGYKSCKRSFEVAKLYHHALFYFYGGIIDTSVIPHYYYTVMS